MALKDLIDQALQNRERIVSASKAYLKGSITLEDYLAQLEGFRREQSRILASIVEEASRLDPVTRARAIAPLLNDGRLGTLSQIVGIRLREKDPELGKWSSRVLEEKFKEAGDPPVPITPVEEVKHVPAPVTAQVAPADEPVLREQAFPAPAEEVIGPSAEAPSPIPAEEAKPQAPPAVTPEPGPRPVPAPERPKLDKEALFTAVDRAVGRVRMTRRERGAIEVYSDLDNLLSKGVLGAEQYLVYIARLVTGYLLGSIEKDVMVELAKEYLPNLKSSAVVVRPEVRELVLEVIRLAEPRSDPDLRSIVAAVQLYLSGLPDVQGREAVAWSRQPSS